MKIVTEHPSLPDSINFPLFKEIAVCYALMNQPDTAIFFLKKALVIGSRKNSPALMIKMLANFYSMNKNYPAADSCFKKALALCQDVNSPSIHKVMVLGDYATFFYDKGNYLNALKLLTEAIALNKSEKKADSTTAILLRAKMADIYVSTKKYDLAKEPFAENIAWLKNSRNYLLLATNYIGLAEVYQGKKEYKESNICYSKALELCTRVKNEEYQYFCLMKLADNNLLCKNPAAGLQSIQKAFAGLNGTNSIYTIEAAAIYLKILHDLGNTTAANVILHDASVQKKLINNNSEFALAYYNATLPFLSAGGNTKEEISTLSKIIVVQDSVNNEAKRKEFLEIDARYQVTLNEENEALLKAKNKILEQGISIKERELTVYVLLGIIVVVILLLSLKKYKQISETKTRALNIKIDENKQLVLQAEKDSAEKLENQVVIEEQKNELLLYIHQIQNLESEIIYATEKNLVEEKSNLTAELTQLKEGKHQLELFMVKFNAIYPDFINIMVKTYPKTSNSDILFCSLIRMNLTPKDISSILNIEQKSVYKRKNRIAEKMGLTDNEQLKDAIFAV